METLFILLDLRLYVLLLQIWIINCVNIDLNEYNKQYSNTKCKSSLTVDRDYFVMNGSVDFSDAGSSWDKLVTVQARNSPRNDFKEICLISTSITENKVTPDSCYCNNCSGDIKHFIINRTAGFQYSKAEIKVLIQSSDGSNSKYSMKKLPEMISLDQTTSILSADGEILTHENCWPNSTLTASKIRLCCKCGDEPCTSVIYKNGVKSNGSSCTGVELKSSEIANLTFELEICGEVLHSAIQSCKIEGKPAENNEQADDTNWIIVGVLLPIIIMMIIIIIIIIIIMLPFKKIINSLLKEVILETGSNIENLNEPDGRNSVNFRFTALSQQDETNPPMEVTNQVNALMAAVHKATNKMLTEVQLVHLEKEVTNILTQKQQSFREACYGCGSLEHFCHDCLRKAELKQKQQQGNASSSASDCECQSLGTEDILKAESPVDKVMAAVRKVTVMHKMLSEEQDHCLENEVADTLDKKQQPSGGACYRCGSREHFFHDCQRKAEWQQKQQQENASQSASDSGCQSLGLEPVDTEMQISFKKPISQKK